MDSTMIGKKKSGERETEGDRVMMQIERRKSSITGRGSLSEGGGAPSSIGGREGVSVLEDEDCEDDDERARQTGEEGEGEDEYDSGGESKEGMYSFSLGGEGGVTTIEKFLEGIDKYRRHSFDTTTGSGNSEDGEGTDSSPSFRDRRRSYPTAFSSGVSNIPGQPPSIYDSGNVTLTSQNGNEELVKGEAAQANTPRENLRTSVEGILVPPRLSNSLARRYQRRKESMSKRETERQRQREREKDEKKEREKESLKRKESTKTKSEDKSEDKRKNLKKPSIRRLKLFSLNQKSGSDSGPHSPVSSPLRKEMEKNERSLRTPRGGIVSKTPRSNSGSNGGRALDKNTSNPSSPFSSRPPSPSHEYGALVSKEERDKSKEGTDVNIFSNTNGNEREGGASTRSEQSGPGSLLKKGHFSSPSASSTSGHAAPEGTGASSDTNTHLIINGPAPLSLPALEPNQDPAPSISPKQRTNTGAPSSSLNKSASKLKIPKPEREESFGSLKRVFTAWQNASQAASPGSDTKASTKKPSRQASATSTVGKDNGGSGKTPTSSLQTSTSAKILQQSPIRLKNKSPTNSLANIEKTKKEEKEDKDRGREKNGTSHPRRRSRSYDKELSKTDKSDSSARGWSTMGRSVAKRMATEEMEKELVNSATATVNTNSQLLATESLRLRRNLQMGTNSPGISARTGQLPRSSGLSSWVSKTHHQTPSTPRPEHERLDEVPAPDALIESSPSPSPRITPNQWSLNGFMSRGSTLVPNRTNKGLIKPGLSPAHTVMEGYLLKRNNRGRWKRRWMVLNNTHFYCFKTPQDSVCSLMIDLLFSSVKLLNMANRHGFELITMDKNYAFDVLTADNLAAWTNAIQKVCSGLNKLNLKSAIQDTSSSDGSQSDSFAGRCAIMKLARMEGNTTCCDCGTPDPEWVLMETGAFICIECATIHRRLGSGISQVRSIHLDVWEPHHIQFIKQNGNIRANRFWEYKTVEGLKKPTPPHIEDLERENYIRAKYEQRIMINDLEMGLYNQNKGSTLSDLKDSILALLREDEGFRNEVRKLLFGGVAYESGATGAIRDVAEVKQVEGGINPENVGGNWRKSSMPTTINGGEMNQDSVEDPQSSSEFPEEGKTEREALSLSLSTESEIDTERDDVAVDRTLAILHTESNLGQAKEQKKKKKKKKKQGKSKGTGKKGEEIEGKRRKKKSKNKTKTDLKKKKTKRKKSSDVTGEHRTGILQELKPQAQTLKTEHHGSGTLILTGETEEEKDKAKEIKERNKTKAKAEINTERDKINRNFDLQLSEDENTETEDTAKDKEIADVKGSKKVKELVEEGEKEMQMKVSQDSNAHQEAKVTEEPKTTISPLNARFARPGVRISGIGAELVAGLNASNGGAENFGWLQRGAVQFSSVEKLGGKGLMWRDREDMTAATPQTPTTPAPTLGAESGERSSSLGSLPSQLIQDRMKRRSERSSTFASYGAHEYEPDKFLSPMETFLNSPSSLNPASVMSSAVEGLHDDKEPIPVVITQTMRTKQKPKQLGNVAEGESFNPHIPIPLLQLKPILSLSTSHTQNLPKLSTPRPDLSGQILLDGLSTVDSSDEKEIPAAATPKSPPNREPDAQPNTHLPVLTAPSTSTPPKSKSGLSHSGGMGSPSNPRARSGTPPNKGKGEEADEEPKKKKKKGKTKGEKEDSQFGPVSPTPEKGLVQKMRSRIKLGKSPRRNKVVASPAGKAGQGKDPLSFGGGEGL